MKNFSGKTAVITGAASGIGKGLAAHAAALGCRVVLADIEGDALTATAEELKQQGGAVLAVITDVSKAGDVERLALAARKEYGAVHLLFNNAGVGLAGPRLWERTLADWQWELNVNLWGTIHGLHFFLPLMMAQDVAGHIVNTASAAGLMSPPGFSGYNASKHGIVTLSETLYHELAEAQSKVKVSVFCPGLVNTRIMDSARNRPQELRNEHSVEVNRQPKYTGVQMGMREAIARAPDPEEIAALIFDAIAEEKFYIFTHAWVKDGVKRRLEDIAQDRSPTNPEG